MTPEFPLRFTDDEQVVHVIGAVRELEETVEYVDDVDPLYHCEDNEGRRVRIVLWDLQLLLLQVVPEDYDGTLVDIVESTGPDGTRVWAEVFRGVPLRSVTETVDGRRSAEPESWNSEVPALATGVETSALRPEEFHDEWLRVKGFRR